MGSKRKKKWIIENSNFADNGRKKKWFQEVGLRRNRSVLVSDHTEPNRESNLMLILNAEYIYKSV